MMFPYASTMKNIFTISTSVALAAILITQPLAIRAESQLEKDFKTPLQAARLQAYWFWVDSNFSTNGITKDLEAMKSAGFGAALILNVGSGALANPPWPDQTYHSQKYFDAIKHAAAEAERLGLTIGLANAPGYTGTGGPWVPEEQNMRRLVWTQKDVEGPQKLDLVLTRPSLPESGLTLAKTGNPAKIYDDIAVLAVPAGKTVALKKVLDITARMHADGRLVWEVPAGKWSVFRIGNMPTLKAPHPAPNGPTANLEVDKMDREANLNHWHNVIEPLKENLGPLYGTSFNRLHIDSYECGTQNWSKHFREEFIRRKGYDPVPWLVSFGTPVLGYKPGQMNGNIMGGMPRNETSRIIESTEQTGRFEWDFVDVVNRLFTDNWILAKSLMAPDHIRFSFEPYAGPFSIIEGAAIADIPMATFWTTTSCDYSLTNMNGDGTVAIETPAGARAAGRTIINSESYTSMPGVSMWTEKPALLKYIADGAFAAGVNQMTLHHWTLQPFDDKYQPGLTFHKWGVHFGRFQTWFEPGKAYFNYLTRCQAMLQQGEEVVESLAIDSPFQSKASKVVDPRTLENPVQKSEHCDLISSYDFVNDDTHVVDGQVQLASGRKYYYLTYPANGVVLPEVAAKLKRLLDEGATLVTTRFKKSSSLKDYPACDQAIATISAGIWDSGKYQGHLFGSTDAAAKQLGLVSDYEIHSARGADSVKVLHRHSSEADIYFVANRLDQPQNFTVDFRVQGKQPELWQAEDLSIGDAPCWKENGGRTSVSLSLGCHQSVIVVFHKPAEQADHATTVTVNDGTAKWSFSRDSQGQTVFVSPANVSAKVVYASGKEKTLTTESVPPVQIDGAWEVSFAHKMGDQFQIQFPTLIDLSQHSDPRVKYFAGTATYRKTIRLDADVLKANRRVILELGTMNDIATVKMNGSAAKVVWYAPYELDVTELLRVGENQLEIAVTDNWANALIGDEQIPADFETPNAEYLAKHPMGFQMPRFPDWFIKGQPRPSVRKTFATWNYYNKNSNLNPAGLVGQVQLRIEEQVAF